MVSFLNFVQKNHSESFFVTSSCALQSSNPFLASSAIRGPAIKNNISLAQIHSGNDNINRFRRQWRGTAVHTYFKQGSGKKALLNVKICFEARRAEQASCLIY